MGNSCSSKISCDSFEEFGGDPDIAGIGVILSFLISAWSTYLFAMGAYLSLALTLVEDDPSMAAFDTHFLRLVRAIKRIMPWTPWKHFRWQFTKLQAQNVCIMAGDQQLVTGAAILLVGHLKHCGITQYHFYITSLMVTLSFATSQLVALITMNALDSQFKRFWRLVANTVLAAGTLADTFVLYNERFLSLDSMGLPIQCVWDLIAAGQGYTGQGIVYVTFGLLFNLWSYLTIVTSLYPTILEWRAVALFYNTAEYVLEYIGRIHIWVSTRRSRYGGIHSLRILEAFTFLIFTIFLTINALLGSSFLYLLRVFMYLIQATYLVFWARAFAKEGGMEDNEDEWGFGQILPLMLLVLPLLGFLEIMYPVESDSGEHEHRHSPERSEMDILPKARRSVEEEQAAGIPNTNPGRDLRLDIGSRLPQVTVRRRTTLDIVAARSMAYSELQRPLPPTDSNPPAARPTSIPDNVSELVHSIHATKWFPAWLGLVAFGSHFLVIYAVFTLPLGFPM